MKVTGKQALSMVQGAMLWPLPVLKAEIGDLSETGSELISSFGSVSVEGAEIVGVLNLRRVDPGAFEFEFDRFRVGKRGRLTNEQENGASLVQQALLNIVSHELATSGWVAFTDGQKVVGFLAPSDTYAFIERRYNPLVDAIEHRCRECARLDNLAPDAAWVNIWESLEHTNPACPIYGKQPPSVRRERVSGDGQPPEQPAPAPAPEPEPEQPAPRKRGRPRKADAA